MTPLLSCAETYMSRSRCCGFFIATHKSEHWHVHPEALGGAHVAWNEMWSTYQRRGSLDIEEQRGLQVLVAPLSLTLHLEERGFNFRGRRG